MPITKPEKCYKCGQEFTYNENEDLNYNDLVAITGRKVVVDDNDNIFHLYAIPPDKRKMVDPSRIHIACAKCMQ